ncbi:MAG: hypothetical protein K940chlam2_00616 [Chlamydiae bacterium]|nr:hypothetical protein [Chlamydiota bacterium]
MKIKQLILTLLLIFTHLSAEEVGYLHLGKERPIDSSAALWIESALKTFEEQNAPLVILHLDTPGGEVIAAERIADALSRSEVPVVALIDQWALSAGALIAYSSPRIIAVEGASMGAAQPVFQAGGKMEEAPEKIVSAVRTQFANRAREWGRNPDIAEAMVDRDIILVKRRGKIQKVDGIRRGDEILSPQGKLLTLGDEELMSMGIVDQLFPRGVQNPKTLGETALGHHPDFIHLKDLPLTSGKSWKIDFFAFLAHPLVASLLAMGLMMGIYMEFSTPGLGVPGGIAIACLALTLISSFAFDVASVLELTLLGVGVVLLALELFVIPGFGIVGILGILLAFVGFIGLLLPLDFRLGWPGIVMSQELILTKLTWILGAMVLGAVILAFLPRHRLPWLLRFVLKDPQIIVNEDPILPARGDAVLAATALRPFGKIRWNGILFSATSEGDYIQSEAELTVVGHKGNQLIVKVR